MSNEFRSTLNNEIKKQLFSIERPDTSETVEKNRVMHHLSILICLYELSTKNRWPLFDGAPQDLLRNSDSFVG